MDLDRDRHKGQKKENFPTAESESRYQRIHSRIASFKPIDCIQSFHAKQLGKPMREICWLYGRARKQQMVHEVNKS